MGILLRPPDRQVSLQTILQSRLTCRPSYSSKFEPVWRSQKRRAGPKLNNTARKVFEIRGKAPEDKLKTPTNLQVKKAFYRRRLNAIQSQQGKAGPWGSPC